jgi:hypothetical protein
MPDNKPPAGLDTRQRIHDRLSNWWGGLSDAYGSGDWGGVAGAFFTPPISLEDVIPSEEVVREAAAANPNVPTAGVGGALAGGAKVVSDFTMSPGNVALGGAMGGLGAVAKSAANPLVRAAARTAKGAASAKFAADAAGGAVESGRQFKQAVDLGDTYSAAKAATEGVGNVGVLATAGAHSAKEINRGVKELMAASPEFRQAVQRVQSITADPQVVAMALTSLHSAVQAGEPVNAAIGPILRLVQFSREDYAKDPNLRIKKQFTGNPGAELQEKRLTDMVKVPYVDKTWTYELTPEGKPAVREPQIQQRQHQAVAFPEAREVFDPANTPGFVESAVAEAQEIGRPVINHVLQKVKDAGFKGYRDGKGEVVLFEDTPVVPVTEKYPLETLAQVQPADIELGRNLSKSLSDNGGFTHNLAQGDLGGKPYYAVSLYPELSDVVTGDVSPERIAAYAAKHRQLLESNPELSIGGWRDASGPTPTTYLDITSTVPDRALAEYLAGPERANQKAIFDLSKFEEIPTGGSGEPALGLPPVEDRLRLLSDQFKQSQPPPAPPAEPGSWKRARPAGSEVSVQDAIERIQRGSRAPLELATENEKQIVRRAVEKALEEGQFQLAKPNSGKDWYKADVAEMEKNLIQLHPELTDPVKMTMFKAILSSTSGEQQPYPNLGTTERIWEQYKTNGRLPVYQPTSYSPETGYEYQMSTFTKEKGPSAGMEVTQEKRWTKRNPQPQLSTLQAMIDEMGEQGASDFLLGDQDVELMRKYGSSVAGNAGEKRPGFYVLGPKYGAFGLNLHGRSTELTMDLWFSRTWNRWMGTMFQKNKDGQIVIGDDGRPVAQEAPRNNRERRLMQQAVSRVSERLGLTASELQAVLWFYEKELYQKYGAKSETESYSGASRRLLEKKSRQNVERPGKSGQDASAGQGAPGARAGKVGHPATKRKVKTS